MYDTDTTRKNTFVW